MRAMNEIAEAGARRGRKFEQVLQGGRRVFLRDGFEGASVDDIAREAGVSKATLYAYFPDKRLLFTEICAAEFRRLAAEAEAEMDPAAPPERMLAETGARIAAFQMSDFGRGMYALMVAEVSRFPEVARNFYATGPGQARGRLVARLQAMADRGDLRIEDCELAADQFVQLCKAGLHERVVLGLIDDIRPEEVARTVKGAVEVFLARYGTRG